MKKKSNYTLLVTTLVCLLPIILSILVYDRLPDQVAIHFNQYGDANNYVPKAVAAFGLPVFMALINIISNFMLEKDPKKENSAYVLRQIGKWSIPVITLLLMPITLFIALGVDVPIETIVPAFVGVLIIVCGNYLPKCKPNYTIGIKLPWTLNSSSNWNKTHHMAGYIWVAGGIFMTVCSFLNIGQVAVTLGVAIVLIVVPAAYSYYLFKKGI